METSSSSPSSPSSPSLVYASVMDRVNSSVSENPKHLRGNTRHGQDTLLIRYELTLPPENVFLNRPALRELIMSKSMCSSSQNWATFCFGSPCIALYHGIIVLPNMYSHETPTTTTTTTTTRTFKTTSK